MTIIPQKTCTRCKQAKPLDQFPIEKRVKDGRKAECKECMALRNRERRKVDPDFRGYSMRYYHEHTKDPAWVARFNEYQRGNQQRWKERNPEKVHENSRKQRNRIANTPAIRAKYTRYEREHRQKRQRTDPVFHEHLMDMAKAGQHKRRARLIGSGGNHTLAEWRALCAQYDHRCLCCGLLKPLTRDHVIPLTLGGDNSIANIQCLCRSCNSAKGNRHTTDCRPT